MRVERIDAIRYGAMSDVSLDGLGEGLTVVLGPNEAGKSTFTSLVRHVLYGFPARSAREKGYSPAAGQRHGRLTFASSDGRWAIERAGDVKGGKVTVTALEGGERPGLVDELTAGVSDHAYRVVYGFGLGELAEIESLRGKESDVVGRLYAASAGLPASPLDVRAELSEKAQKLFAPRAQSRVINQLARELKDVRKRRREMDGAAMEYVAEREHLEGLQQELETAREQRAMAQNRLAELAAALGRMKSLAAAIEETERELEELEQDIDSLEAQLATIDLDDAILLQGAAIDSLWAELSGFRRDMEEMREARLAADEADLALRRTVLDANLAEDELLAVPTDADAVAEMERHVEVVRRRQVEADTRGGRPSEGPPSAAPAPLLAGAVGVLLGLAFTVVGLLQEQYVGVFAGLVLAAIALVSSYLGVRSRRVAPLEEDGASTGESRALDSALADWAQWAAAHALPQSHPADARRLVALATQAKAARADADRALLRIARAEETVGAFAARMAEIAPSGDGRIDPMRVSDHLLSQKDRLDSAREARRLADKLKEGIEEATRRRKRLKSALTDKRKQRDGVIRDASTSGDAPETLGVEHALAEAEYESAQAHFDDLANTVSSARGVLEEKSRGLDSSDLKLQEAALTTRLADAVEEYAVLAVADALLAKAQERYESEKQPHVVKRAEEIFSAMTGGRYIRLNVPLAGGEIAVADETGRAMQTPLLSRGTAEQLYLALRLALLETMGDTGAALPVLMDDVLVDFDPDRAARAAEAVLELATLRQVVLFTCHPSTVELFTALGDTRVVSLGRC